MNIVSRAMSGADDPRRILEFSHRHADMCFHVVDLPYRLCSPAAQDALNVRLWETIDGELVGFSVVQLPFSTVDWAVQLGYEQLADQIVGAAVERVEGVAKQREDGFGFLLDSRSEQDPITLKYGFELDDWHMRHLSLTLKQPIPAPQIPPGFTLRPLAGQSEVTEYVALHREAFNTRNMTVDWRERTLQHPLYSADLDLVVEDADGKLVAFCIGWMCDLNGEPIGQIEPLGVHPEHQKKGLGRAILLENLRRMQQHGVRNVLIDAESYNPASQYLYESVGFRDVSRTIKHFHWFG